MARGGGSPGGSISGRRRPAASISSKASDRPARGPRRSAPGGSASATAVRGPDRSALERSRVGGPAVSAPEAGPARALRRTVAGPWPGLTRSRPARSSGSDPVRLGLPRRIPLDRAAGRAWFRTSLPATAAEHRDHLGRGGAGALGHRRPVVPQRLLSAHGGGVIPGLVLPLVLRSGARAARQAPPPRCTPGRRGLAVPAARPSW